MLSTIKKIMSLRYHSNILIFTLIDSVCQSDAYYYYYYFEINQNIHQTEIYFSSQTNISIMPKKPKYFTSNEVAIHNTAKDIWVSFLGKVYDLTAFVEANAG